MPATRILVVDDHPVARRSICILLSGHEDLEVIGEAVDGETAVKKTEELRPDLILLDIGLPGISGIDAAVKIRETSPDSLIVFLSQYDSTGVAKAAFNTGGRGYVVKSDAGRDLLKAIREVRSGRRFISQTLSSRGLELQDATQRI